MTNRARDRKYWDVVYITSQGTYVDHNTQEPRDGEDIRKNYKTRTAWIGKHGNNPASFRSINLEIGD